MNKFHIKDLIRKIISEQLVTESMNVSIEGVDYKRFDDLNSLSYHLLDKIVSPVITKLPQDQLEYFKKNSIPFYKVIVPDGSYDWNEMAPTGIINFYISGFTSKTLQIILKNIFNEFRRLGIKWGKLKREKSGIYKSEVIRIPIVSNKQTYSGPPEVNLANANAYHIFHNILQYEGVHGFSMDAQDLKDRIESLSGDKPWLSKHIRKPTDTKMEPELPGDEWKHVDDDGEKDVDDPLYNPHMDIINKIGGGLGARVISGGMDEEDILRRLNAIWQVADWAVKHGYKKIFVG